ncbi:MAG: glycoside hydrolase family 9 protein [Verrucomicrobiota bacterium]
MGFSWVVSALSAAALCTVAVNARNPLALPAVGESELNIIAPTVLELNRVTTKAPDPAVPADWNFIGANFAAILPTPSDFQVTVDGNPVTVTEVGFKRRPLYAPLKKRDLRIGNSLYLRLANPVGEGHRVVVSNASGVLWDDTKISFSATTDSLRRNPAIHVNQTGYIPGFSKKAMVGYYLGSLGELTISASEFHLVNASTHDIAFTGPLKPRPDVGWNYNPLPYQQVLEADFTEFNTPGEYLLEVPGMGTSFPFLINDGTGAAFARAFALGLYHQRCGTNNVLPYSRFEHDVCHAAPAQVPTMDFTAVNRELAGMSSDYANNPLHTAPQLKDVNSSLYPFINQGPIDVSGGHHDAGDYSKYTINSASLVHHLIFAVDSLAGVGDLDNIGLPESGDGIPDLLQEAKWEADFLAKLQEADGGFYFLVYPRDREYEDDVLPDHGDPQIVFPKTTAATAAAVGALAEIASSPRFKQHYPEAAANYLAKAKLGWDFLTRAIAKYGKNGAYQKITHYGNEFMHDDELAWAAAALFVATGEQGYHDQLRAWFNPSDPNTRRWSWWRMFEGYGCAVRAYAFAARSGRLGSVQLDANYLKLCEDEVVAAGDDIARFAEQTAYGTSFPDPNKSFRTAGWYFSSERSFEMATAYQITPKQRYVDALVSNMNYEGGCNPVNVSYITGLGWNRWREIVHQYAQNDHRVLPPSGLPLGNIQGGFAWLENYKTELGALCYPPDGASSAPYPFYDRWGDSFNTTTEFVVVDQARSLAALAFLMARTPAASSPGKPAIADIVGLPDTIPAGEPVTASLQIDGEDLSLARIVWEARDQEPFIGAQFTFAPKNPGEQWIEVEAQMPDGRRIYATSSITASTSETSAPNSFQSAPLRVTPEIIALYHLDADGADATGRNPSLGLSGNARLDSLNLGWMSSRSGKALHFDDLGDKATVTIPSVLLNGDADAEITLEAMVFVNSLRAWNRGSARMLSLQNNWNANLEWMEDTYTGAHLRGGTEFDLTGSALGTALAPAQWHHLSITISRSGYSTRVDGIELSAASSSEFANWSTGSSTLEIGNFDGWIDEVVIRNKRSVITTPVPTPDTLRTRIELNNGHLQVKWNAMVGKSYKVYAVSALGSAQDKRLVGNVIAESSDGSFDFQPTEYKAFFLVEQAN